MGLVMAKKKTARAVKSVAPKIQENGLPEGLAPEDIKPIDVPMFGGSGVTVQGTGNDFSLIFTRVRPAILAKTGQPAPVALSEPAVIINVSPQTLKDLSIVLAEQVAGHEKLFGPIVSPFTRGREAVKTKTKH